MDDPRPLGAGISPAQAVYQKGRDTAGEITTRRQTDPILCIVVEFVRATVLFFPDLASWASRFSRSSSAPANSPAVSEFLCDRPARWMPHVGRHWDKMSRD